MHFARKLRKRLRIPVKWNFKPFFWPISAPIVIAALNDRLVARIVPRWRWLQIEKLIGVHRAGRGLPLWCGGDRKGDRGSNRLEVKLYQKADSC
jgi:hypothetical protein